MSWGLRISSTEIVSFVTQSESGMTPVCPRALTDFRHSLPLISLRVSPHIKYSEGYLTLSSQ